MYKPNILFFIESLQCGGAEKSLASLLQLIDYTKVDVDLMLLRDGGLYRGYVPPQVNVVSMPEPWGIRRVWHKMCLDAFSVALRLEIMSGRHGAERRWIFEHSALPRIDKHYDVAIAYQQGFPTFYLSNAVSADKRLAWVNTNLKSAGYDEEFCRRFYDSFDSIVVVSEKLYHDLMNSGYMDNNKLTTVYDILNVDLICRMSREHIDMQPTQSIDLVTVGRMAKAKNYSLAVETARVLRDRGFAFRWVLVGGGTELPYVKSLIDKYGLNDTVIPVGEQANPYPYMAQADIYVHTASFEGYGLTIAEAKILGKPVVSTNFTVVYDQITDGENGLIAEMTPESVADKIMLLANDPELRDRITNAVKVEKNSTATTEIGKFYKLIGVEQ